MGTFKFDCLLRATITIVADSPEEAEATLKDHFQYEDEDTTANFGCSPNGEPLLGTVRRAGYSNDFTQRKE